MERTSRFQCDLTVERVSGVGTLQFDQLGTAAFGQQHGPQFDYPGNARATAVGRGHPGQDSVRQWSGRLHLDITTKQFARIGPQRIGNLCVQSATGSHKRYTQYQAGNKDPELPAAGAQITPGQAK